MKTIKFFTEFYRLYSNFTCNSNSLIVIIIAEENSNELQIWWFSLQLFGKYYVKNNIYIGSLYLQVAVHKYLG